MEQLLPAVCFKAVFAGREKIQIFAPCHIRIKVVFCFQIGNIQPFQRSVVIADRACGWTDEGIQRIQQSRFSGTVQADQTMYFP